MGLDREVEEDIWEFEGEIHKGANVSSARSRLKKIRIEVNASDYATEEVLSMECEDGKWWPVAFLSKSLNETKRNYEIHNKEMLVVIRELENWRHLLEGMKNRFEIWIDHKNLKYFIKAQKLNHKQAQ